MKSLKWSSIGYLDYAGDFASVSINKNRTIMRGDSVYCREIFHRRSRNFSNIAYNIGNQNIENFAKFINEVENKLKIKKKSEVYFVEKENNFAVVKVSDWWKKEVVRKHFFTIVLRLACKKNRYNNKILYNNTFNKILYNNKYFNSASTKYAAKKFMNGYTRCKGWQGGFVRTFGQNPVKLADKKLFK